jgi:hypothetical protein
MASEGSHFWRNAVLAVVLALIAAIPAYKVFFSSDAPGDTKGSSPSPGVSQVSPGVPPSAAPSTQYLADLTPAGTVTPDEDSKTIASTPYSQSVSRELLGCHGQLSAIEYALGGKWRTFEAMIGLDDGSRPNTEARFNVYLDRSLVHNGYAVTRDSPRKISVSVVGVKFLRLQAQPTAGDLDSCVSIGTAVWGDAKLSM